MVERKKFPQVGELVMVNKLQIHVVCKGPVGAPVVIFESGAGGWSLDWSVLETRLSDKLRVCAYDRPGHGWSSRTSEPRDADTITRELAILLDALNVDTPIILVGHSYGGFLAKYFAQRYPERVAGLVMIEPLTEEFASVPAYYAPLMRLAAVVSNAGVLRTFNLARPPTSAPPSVQQAILSRAYLPSTFATIADEADALDESFSLLKSLPPLHNDIPVKIISRGLEKAPTDLGRAWAKGQKALAASLPSAQHYISDSDDHYLQFSDPNFLATIILDLAETRHH
jgi:pimeloyl-ACP methyl ester carboxylesterase